MKNFNQYLLENDEIEEDDAIKSKLDKSQKQPNKGASRAITLSMNALKDGNIELHRFWLARAFKRLTGQPLGD